ncbi:MAG TPA: alpha/beta fold hydrolase [Ilumatobacteraceae bacterium]|nr:alpha/beta fold hydrolase [Ilumatobacteraceae bacterium]
MDRPAPAFYELSAIAEFGAFFAAAPWLATAPRGRGGRVLVLPGFTAGDVSTAPLRAALRALGHKPSPWGLGLNVGPDDETVRQLLRLLDKLVQQNGGPIDIVGWSLGGIMARLLALHHPDRVRQVISLGSPIHIVDPEANVSDSVRRLSQLAGLQRNRRSHDLTEIPVPSTVIFSRGDGVVAAASCIQPVGPTSENIEVRGAHIGLGHNPAVVWAVADRLAQVDGHWEPFVPPSLLRWCYPNDQAAAPTTIASV